MADIFERFFDARLDTEPLAKYLEIFALKCKRTNELWLFESWLWLFAAFKVWFTLQYPSLSVVDRALSFSDVLNSKWRSVVVLS